MGKSAPSPDPRMGEAAMKSAATGERYLEWMQGLSGVTQGWAETDRARFKGVFEPLENQMVADAQSYASPARREMSASEAIADVRQQAGIGRQMQTRQLASMGVNPASGRFAAETRRSGTAETLAAAGAGNMARRQTDAIGDAKMANMVNMGRGMAVNPGTSMGMAGNMGSAGFSGAMQGYGQQASIFGQQHQQQVNAVNSENAMWGSVGQGLGMLVGASGFMSTKESKTKIRKPMSVLETIKGMPVKEWEYKQGMGDGGGQKHVGAIAEDWKKSTGLGDGKSISIIDAIGVNLGAAQELTAKVEKLEARIRKLDDYRKPKAKEAA
jgi:hypothetical protein